MHRAYSTFIVKDVDDDLRVLEGIASSPQTDRVGDIVEPKGAKFTLPLPLLWQHRSDQPIGHVTHATVTPEGIRIKAQIAKGLGIARIDEAWTLIKAGLVRGFSIGFKDLESEDIKGAWGSRFLKWEWLELSAVTIPANQDASIQTIKSLDVGLAVSGTGPAVDSVKPPVLSGTVRVKTRQDTRMTKLIGEQIKDLDNSRAAKVARMSELQDAAVEAGRTKDEAEKEEFDTLRDDIKGLDAELVDLHEMERINVQKAVPVNGDSLKGATQARQGFISVKSTVPKGTAFTRYAMAIAAGRGSRLEAAEYAKRWDGSTPEVSMCLKAAITGSMPNLAEMLVKAAVAPGSTLDSDWAAPLVVYQNMANEFIELLRAETILDKITGLRRVPFNISIPRQTQAGTVGWVGQSKPKPVGELKFDQVTLGMAKAAGIILLNEELVRSSDPSAEGLVRADLIATMADYLDVQLLDPSVAEVTNVSPAAITNGVTPVDSTGTNYAALVADVKSIFALFTAANIKRSGMVAIMSETQAQALSMMLNALGLRSLPDVNMNGGTLFGIPVITSENVPLDGGSPEGGRIIFVSAPNVLLADDGGVSIDVSREASVQMNSTPDDPASASTVIVSLWQHNLVGLRAERFINWKKRRDAAVQYINDANYS